MRHRALQKQLHTSAVRDLRYRERIFAEYYGLTLDFVDQLILAPAEERARILQERGLNRYLYRTFFEYNRYEDCHLILEALDNPEELRGARVLDFGCSVADHGYFFGMAGAEVTLCDFPEFLSFASFRLSRAGIPYHAIPAPVDYHTLTQSIDLAVFGEVLEHLKDPLLMLQCCVEHRVSMIYTSRYPFGDETYFSLNGHTREAQAQSPASLALLRAHYQEVSINPRTPARLWMRL